MHECSCGAPPGCWPHASVHGDEVPVWALGSRSAQPRCNGAGWPPARLPQCHSCPPPPQAVETAADVIEGKPDCCATPIQPFLSPGQKRREMGGAAVVRGAPRAAPQLVDRASTARPTRSVLHDPLSPRPPQGAASRREPLRATASHHEPLRAYIDILARLQSTQWSRADPHPQSSIVGP